MKKLLPIMFVLGLIIPQISYASWWNPFTWNKAITSPIQISTTTLNNNVTSEQVRVKEIPTTQAAERVVEKIVTQTVKVDNPELQEKINALIQQNTDLQIKLSSLNLTVQQLNMCKADLVDAKSQISKNSTNSDSVPTSSTQTSNNGIKVVFGTLTCSSIPHMVKVPVIISGGWWESGEMKLSKNLVYPNEWTIQDSILTKELFPGMKLFEVGYIPGSYNIDVRLSDKQRLNGELDLRSNIYSYNLVLDIPIGLPCQ